MLGLSASRIYLIISGATTLFNALMFTVLSIYYIQTAGLNPFQLVLVGTVVEATIVLFEVPTGVVADTYSRRLSVIIGYLLIGLCFVVEGLVPLFGAILLAEVVRGLGETFVSGAREAWIADEVGEARVGQVYLRAAQVRQVAHLIGIALSVVLASVQLNLPVILGGALTMALAIFLMVAMPETGFQPAPRREGISSWRALHTTLRDGLRVARASPTVPLLLTTGIVGGAFSEGFDRLWEAHLLLDITFPEAGGLTTVVWFGLVRMGAALLTLPAVEFVRRRLDIANPRQAARALVWVNGLLMVSVIAFGLVNIFVAAVAAYWLASALRTLNEPITTTWLNQNLDPRVRATVLSLRGQADALGQIGGGPVIGLVATIFSLRAALVGAGLLLSPALLLYGRALRRGQVVTPAAPNTRQPGP